MAFSWNPFKRTTINESNEQNNINNQQTAQSNDFKDNEPVQNNPNYQKFARVNSDIDKIISQRSVIEQDVERRGRNYSNPTWQTFATNDLLAIPLSTNKAERITNYRTIAKYNKCDWALDEIADDFLHEDDLGRFISLKLPDRLSPEQNKIIQNEFDKFISLFNLKDNGYTLIKRFLIEGELAWENIINPKYEDLGITGIKFLPAEYYETMVDQRTGRPVGLVFDTDKFSKEYRDFFMNYFSSTAQLFNAVSPITYSYQFTRENCVPLIWSQVTYVNSGEYSSDNLIVYPLIEKARAAYQRLAAIEDACIVLRVTHAPERLLFNISTGNMSQRMAEEYVRRFAMELKSKKVTTHDGQDVSGVYSQSPAMNESWVFGKAAGDKGTEVTSVGSQVSYNEMEDVEYFLREFLKQLKIPWSRYKTPENTIEKNDTITYEEYSFMRMIIRLQRRFALGLKKSFIVHLKFRNLWDKKSYELKESDIDMSFTAPVLYDLYERQKLVEAKMSIYKTFADQDEMSKTIAMKKYLGFTDDDIKDNDMSLIKEKQMAAIADMYADSISQDNPPVDIKSPIRRKSDVDADKKLNGVVNPNGNSSPEGGEGGEEGNAGGDDSTPFGGGDAFGGGGEDAGGGGEEDNSEPAQFSI